MITHGLLLRLRQQKNQSAASINASPASPPTCLVSLELSKMDGCKYVPLLQL